MPTSAKSIRAFQWYQLSLSKHEMFDLGRSAMLQKQCVPFELRLSECPWQIIIPNSKPPLLLIHSHKLANTQSLSRNKPRLTWRKIKREMIKVSHFISSKQQHTQKFLRKEVNHFNSQINSDLTSSTVPTFHKAPFTLNPTNKETKEGTRKSSPHLRSWQLLHWIQRLVERPRFTPIPILDSHFSPVVECSRKTGLPLRAGAALERWIFHS